MLKIPERRRSSQKFEVYPVTGDYKDDKDFKDTKTA
jgi:hypothetical protein